jgi:hypothetical protein
MTSVRSLGIVGGLLCGLALPAARGEDAKTAELAWAKEVATDFLSAGLGGNYASAEALATAEFKKTLQESGPSSITFLLSSAAGGAESWTIGTEEIAPDKDEAVFRGAFRGKKGEATFSLRVAKEKDGGKWRVSFFAADAWKERGDKRGK